MTNATRQREFRKGFGFGFARNVEQLRGLPSGSVNAGYTVVQSAPIDDSEFEEVVVAAQAEAGLAELYRVYGALEHQYAQIISIWTPRTQTIANMIITSR